jgi:hypothetical protein
MIEIHDLKGTQSYGCFENMKSSKPTLDLLKERGELSAPQHTVIIRQYKNQVLQKIYKVRHVRNKWRILPLNITDFTPTPAA